MQFELLAFVCLTNSEIFRSKCCINAEFELLAFWVSNETWSLGRGMVAMETLNSITCQIISLDECNNLALK